MRGACRDHRENVFLRLQRVLPAGKAPSENFRSGDRFAEFLAPFDAAAVAQTVAAGDQPEIEVDHLGEEE